MALNDPHDDTPLLLFDGECGFCTLSVLWLMRRLRRPVRIEPWQRTALADYGLTPELADRYAWWIERGRPLEPGYRAGARALMACGGAWAWVGRLLIVPPVAWLARLAYRLIAINRGRLPGVTPACRRPEWPPPRGAGGGL